MAPSDDEQSRENSGERGSAENTSQDHNENASRDENENTSRDDHENTSRDDHENTSRDDNEPTSQDDNEHTSRDDNDELASKSLRIQSKRYYVDVKQNNRGKFVKLVEGLPNGNKNRISFPMSTVADVTEKLSAFADYYAEMEPRAEEKEGSDDGRDSGRQALKSDDIRAGQRRIYFDLKENKRGVYLRISSTAQYSSQRHTIALPAEGILEVRDTLKEFYEQYGGSESDEPEELPEFQEMRVERKRFYFDCGSNDRGSFLRISEVTNRYRSSITIPKQGLHKFRDIVDEMISKMDGE